MNFNLFLIYIYKKEYSFISKKIGIKGRIFLTAFKIIQIYIEIHLTI